MRMRKTAPADVPALKNLWKACFSDEISEIDAFFDNIYPTAFGFCAEEDGAICAMAYVLPVTLLEAESTVFGTNSSGTAPADPRHRAGYVYAVATAEARRGLGIAAALLAFVEREMKKRYFECLLLVPAEEGLAGYYRKLGFREQRGCQMQTLRVEKARGSAEAVTVADYAGLRETMLFDVGHVQYPKALLDYAARRAKLYRLEVGGGLGCAAVYMEGKVAVVEELLPDVRYLPALAAEVGAERYVVRTPGSAHGCCMAKWLDKGMDEAVYLPFALD